MENNFVKGYKVFNSDWTCRGFQYTCPGVFEEDVDLSICERGFHFCTKAVACFNYYSFNPKNKVAEVVALGEVVTKRDKSCTNKIQIVREISWSELLNIVNTGIRCTGHHNSGDYNSGCYNSGCYNDGHYNSGDYNSGNYNSGNYNSGNYNSGNYNSGYFNSGNYNSGNYNSGNYNSGYFNSGNFNTTNYSSGCFCTKEPIIKFFNKNSNWTMQDWIVSEARNILYRIFNKNYKWIFYDNMSEQERENYPEANTIGGYLKCMNNIQESWNNLSDNEKEIVMSIPNFDAKIFKETTGIDVEK